MTVAVPSLGDESGILAAVHADPRDDTRRLAYADWLEEHAGIVACPQCGWAGGYMEHRRPVKCDTCRGSGSVSDGRRERAEFIRVQCELARADPFGGYECKCCGNRPRYEDGTDSGELEHGRGCYTQSEDGGGSEYIDVEPGYLALRQRERELLRAVWRQVGEVKPLSAFVCEGVSLDRAMMPRCEFRRGFVESVSCTLADFLTHAAAVFAAHPVERVTLTDREPQDYHNNDDTLHEGRLYGWYDGWYGRATDFIGEVYDLPDEVWGEVARLPGCAVHGYWADFKTPAAAVDALSLGAVNYCRLAAGYGRLP